MRCRVQLVVVRCPGGENARERDARPANFPLSAASQNSWRLRPSQPSAVSRPPVARTVLLRLSLSLSPRVRLNTRRIGVENPPLENFDRPLLLPPVETIESLALLPLGKRQLALRKKRPSI